MDTFGAFLACFHSHQSDLRLTIVLNSDRRGGFGLYVGLGTPAIQVFDSIADGVNDLRGRTGSRSRCEARRDSRLISGIDATSSSEGESE